MVDWGAVLAFLKSVDWQVVSSVATAGALLVSAGVFRIQLVDRRRLRADQARAQAEQVAGWLTFDREKRSWTAYVKNGSTQPVYDVAYIVRDLNNEDTDAAMPEFIPVIPPETTWSWEPSFFGPESFGMSEEDVEDVEDDPMIGTIYGVGENAYIGSIRNMGGIKKRAAEGYINHRPYMSYRDGRGLSWARDTHGRIRSVRRPIDWAPRAGRITGRIKRWSWFGP